jgi:hypothetical protein
MRRGAIALALVALPGCGGLQRMLRGTETLEGRNVHALRLGFAGGQATVCAGEPAQLQVSADVSDGPTLSTWNTGAPTKRHLELDEFRFTATSGQAGADGAFVVPNEGLALLGREVVVEATSEHAPGRTARLAFTPHFGCGVALAFDGADGARGPDGPMGRSGEYGKSESSSGSYARPGGHGTAGGRGADGGRGAPATHGHNVSVDLGLVRAPDGTELALARVTDHGGGATRTVLLDPKRGGKLVVGGSGGNTYSGARAGQSGQRGQDGAAPGRPGKDGPPAHPQATPRDQLFPDAAQLGLR